MAITQEQLAALAAPFPLPAHTVREGFKNGNKTKIRWFVYVDVREVVAHLDAVFPGGWSTTKPEIIPLTTGIIATIGISIGGETRWYSGADDFETDYKTGEVMPSSDQGKGAVTDAIRRAASLWGVAEYIYSMDFEIWTDSYERGDWDKQKALKQEALKKFTEWYNRQFKAAPQPPKSVEIPTPAPTTPQTPQNAGNVLSDTKNDQPVNGVKYRVDKFYVNLNKKNEPYLVFTVGEKLYVYCYSRQLFTDAGYDTELWKNVGNHEMPVPAIITAVSDEKGKFLTVKHVEMVDAFAEAS